jgi:hypothetical protein
MKRHCPTRCWIWNCRTGAGNSRHDAKDRKTPGLPIAGQIWRDCESFQATRKNAVGTVSPRSFTYNKKFICLLPITLTQSGIDPVTKKT